ncbi:hypothetical protein IWQ57_000073 [Coemansia nantahalensis]|uniref:Uncharacterized protein n=1 Tax=Coemansia nantahalensis TaxID=2789366 RepID=A0ACC1K8N6_9FUNG|nr:hypothetical protein IWQ57_000073 [Coemansia nantahalensis]
MMEDLRRCPFQHDGTVYYWGDQSRTQYIPILVAPELAGTHMTITNTLPKLVDPLVPLPINGFNTEFMTGTLGVKDMGSFPHELHPWQLSGEYVPAPAPNVARWIFPPYTPAVQPAKALAMIPVRFQFDTSAISKATPQNIPKAQDARTCDQQRTNCWRRAAPSIQPKQ